MKVALFSWESIHSVLVGGVAVHVSNLGRSLAADGPVVATRNGGPWEFVRHGENGFTIYDNPDSVGWGLGTLFTDFENARRMGANGRADAERRFDWSAISRQVADVYHE